ncbi:DUF2179 domain-containing protein [Mycoplasmopsis caviae]
MQAEKDKEILNEVNAYERDVLLNNTQIENKHVEEHHEINSIHLDDVVNKKNTQYKYTKMSNFVLKLSRFYAPMPLWKLGLITAALAVFFGVIGIFFVKNPGIYNFGLAAFGQAISRLTNVLLRGNPNVTPAIYNVIDHALFWILYLVLSIPIFIFGWKKVGKVFTILTLEFLVVSSLVSFALGQIPGISNAYIIGNFSHEDIPNELREAIQKKYWASKGQLWSLIPLQWKDGGNIVAQVIFSIAYGWMLAFFFAIIAIMGGSAGVTGIIGEYMAVVKQKNFGTINGYINLVIIIVSVIIGTYLPGSLLLQDLAKFENENIVLYEKLIKSDPSIEIAYNSLKSLAWKPPLYFSPNFISTFVCNVIFVIYLNKLFPRYKIVQVKIYSPHMSAIREAIITDRKTVNSFTITKGVGGYSGNNTKVLSSITLYNQVPRLIKKVRSVDQNSLITISNVASVDGKIYLPEAKF